MIPSNLKRRKICVNILIEKRRKGRVIQKNNRTLKIEYREIYRKIRKRASQKRERCKEDDRRSTGNGWYDVIGRSAKLKQRSGLITGEGMNAPRHHQRSKKVTLNVFRFPWMGVYRGKVLGVHFLKSLPPPSLKIKSIKIKSNFI